MPSLETFDDARGYDPVIHDPERSDVRQHSREAFLVRLAGIPLTKPWWSAVIITAGSQSQAEIYPQQTRQRSGRGRLE